MRRSSTQKIAFLGLCASVALILAYLESLLPPLFSAIPGIKLGLPNIAIIFVLYRYGVRRAAIVSFIRIAVVTMLFGNPMTFAYSLAGAALSLLVMALLRRADFLSTVGVSVDGGALHCGVSGVCGVYGEEKVGCRDI